MKILRKAIFIMVILFPLALAQAEDYTQEQWVAFINQSFPSFFCGTDQFFRECFGADEDECKDRVISLIEGCIENNILEIPEVLPFDERRRWGAIIEKCVEKEYVSTYADFLIDSDQCKSFR